MVWWIDRSSSSQSITEKFAISEDRIFQSKNIVFTFSHDNYDARDIKLLLSSGVNVFNIDSKKSNNSISFQIIKKAVHDSAFISKKHSSFYKPVGLSMTVSVFDTIEIDQRTDFIILKDVLSEEHVIDFKARNMKFHMPILIWISKYCAELATELIRISEGVVLESDDLFKINSCDVAKICKLERKPILCHLDLNEKLNETHGAKRKLITVASDIVNSNIDGIVTIPNNEATINKESEYVQEVVLALKLAERKIEDYEKVYNVFRENIKIPQLSPIAVAFAANLTALKYGADAIIILTVTGKSAEMVSALSPPCHIVAITAHKTTARLMHLYRKVIPLYYKERRAVNWREECRNRVLFGTEFALKTGLFGYGAKLVVLMPSEEGAGYCDGFQIVTVPFRCAE